MNNVTTPLGRDVRFIFEKTDTARYLSHLDIMKLFARSFVRAGARLKHSEGFNPHPHISIAHPLPVGFSGFRELLDVTIAAGLEEFDDIRIADKLNAALPRGLRILEVGDSAKKVRDIASARYHIELLYPEDMRGDNAELSDKITAVFGAEQLLVTKKSKRGQTEVDLRQHIKSLFILKCGEGAMMELQVKVEEAPISPRLFTGLLKDELAPEHIRYTRVGFFDVDRTAY